MEEFENKIFVFKVTLKGSSSKIWRRIHISPLATFTALEVLIQCSMGWSGNHNHKFIIKHPVHRESVVMVPECELAHPWTYGANLIDENDAILLDYFTSWNHQGFYVYDFADDWIHYIRFERCIDVYDDVDAPTLGCVGGEGLCPPEDCGGMFRFDRLLSIMRDPENPVYDEVIGWFASSNRGLKFLAGEKFDRADVNSCSVM